MIECQQVYCAWCGWEGDSPVKRELRRPGSDYPIQCGHCGAIGLTPITDELYTAERASELRRKRGM